MNVAPVKTRSLVEEVSEQLANFVREPASGGQAKLPSERKLAEKFGVARGVVREAIKRLEMQGLLEVRQGSGVRPVDRLHKPLNLSLELLIPDLDDRLRQLTDARIAIEPAIAEEAARNASYADLAQLRRIQRDLKTAENLESAVELDIDFHRSLANIAGNEVFKLILESTADLSRESRIRTIGNVGANVAAKHHEAILKAIEAGNSAAAGKAMQRHLLAAKDDLAK